MTDGPPRDRRPSELDQDLDSEYDPEAEPTDREGDAPDTDDQRSPFERDRDRILYSREFRRLKDVTQVARAGESYLYHDRLTHSLKVAQVGRRLAELLGDFYEDEFEGLENHLSPDVVEAASLVHDIGHPPFGHEIEELLDDKVREKSSESGADGGERKPSERTGGTQGFEGNTQSFRAVTRLGSHRKSIEGLDLTRATLNAVQKYPWSRAADVDVSEDTDNKWGYYPSEEGYFDFARARTSDDRNKTLEAEIMDYADDLTYAIHDVEDFYRSGLLPLDRLLQEARRLSNRTGEENGGTEDEAGDSLLNYAKDEGMELYDFGQYVHDETELDVSIEGVLSFFVNLRDFAAVYEEFHTPYEGTQLERKLLNEFSSSMIGGYIEAEKDDPDDVERTLVELGAHGADQSPTLEVDDDLRREIGILKQLTFYYVVSDPTLRGQQIGQIQVVDELFELLYDEAEPDSVDRSAVLEPYRGRLDRLDEDDATARARIVADMISNMTETQAIEMYERMSGARPGSIQNDIMRQ